MIVMKLLDEVKDKSIDSNNKSTVITCLMTAYMLKHLNKNLMFAELIDILKNQDMHYGDTFKKVIKTGILYFA